MWKYGGGRAPAMSVNVSGTRNDDERDDVIFSAHANCYYLSEMAIRVDWELSGWIVTVDELLERELHF